ncbi:CRISPR-associated endonuclease Cas2 [Ornithinibacillus sp. 4-3]|uniref:CRISPR-associated endoribonuclease Cas2 n=1 Tax=Ornithinibacillus sp. 4-3 TaxID=3231488 RepID=A0AB39HSC8_9BACI
MLILVTYDVSIETDGGKKRLRKVAKICEDYGIRVQNSVFECNIDSAQYVMLKNKLSEIINFSHDSLRFYRLGENYKTKVEHLGANDSIVVDEPLIF